MIIIFWILLSTYKENLQTLLKQSVINSFCFKLKFIFICMYIYIRMICMFEFSQHFYLELLIKNNSSIDFWLVLSLFLLFLLKLLKKSYKINGVRLNDQKVFLHTNPLTIVVICECSHFSSYITNKNCLL